MPSARRLASAFPSVVLAALLTSGTAAVAAAEHPASPRIIREQMFGVARLYEYAVRCGAAPAQSRGLLALHETNLHFFKALDDLRSLHRDATTRQEAEIRVDLLPRDLDGAASLDDVTTGWKQGLAEADAHDKPSAKLCQTVMEALPQGDDVAAKAAADLLPRSKELEQHAADLSGRLKGQRDAARK